MRYPFIFWAAIALVAVVAILAYRAYLGRVSKEPTWLANTAAMRTLPAFRSARSQTRFATATLTALLVGLSLSIGYAASGPVDRESVSSEMGDRDIVLCLDASGSMLPYDSEILENFQEMVEEFEGERISLQLWSAQTETKFPLTDDYALADRTLAEAAKLINQGYIRPEGDYVLVTPELQEYLKGVEAPDEEMVSSLIGDGLASCVLGFDLLDEDRTRIVVLATDNEAMGPQIYSLQQAVDFADEQDVHIIALYPSVMGAVTTEGEEMKALVEESGGEFYNMDDPAAVDGIIDSITEEDLTFSAQGSQIIETDKPILPVLWTVWLLLGFVAVGLWRRV